MMTKNYLQENHDDNNVCSQTRRIWNSNLQGFSDNDMERLMRNQINSELDQSIPNKTTNDIEFTDITEKIETNKSSLSLCSYKSDNNELLHEDIAHEACGNNNGKSTAGDNSSNNQNLVCTTNHSKNQNYCYEQVDENNDNNGYYEQEIQDDGDSEYNSCYEKVYDNDGQNNTSASDSCTDGGEYSSDENEHDFAMPKIQDDGDSEYNSCYEKVYENDGQNNNTSASDSCTDGGEYSSDENEHDFAMPSKNDRVIFNKIMFESSNLTFSLRFQLSDEGQQELINLLKICAGPRFHDLSLSKHIISQCFSTQIENVTYHYFCCKCSKKIVYSTTAQQRLKSKNIICDKCEERNLIRTNSPNYFISIDLSYQIMQLFTSVYIFDNLLKNVQARTTTISNHDTIKDIYIFDNLLKNVQARTTTISNHDTIKDVYNGQICQKILQSHESKEFEYLLTLNFNTDGAPLTKSGKRAFWPLQLILNDLSPKLRFEYVLLAGLLITDKEPKSNLMNLCSMENGSTKRGVKGYSSLQNLRNFDMVWSYSYEYMHGLLLGVTLQIWNEWKSGCSSYKLTNKNIIEIERRYLSITPSHEIHRLPRAGIFHGSMKPKASEMKSWLLCFSLPCLNGILKKKLLVHYSLLVKSAYTLLKSEISENELRECEFDLLKFVCEYEIFYGEERKILRYIYIRKIYNLKTFNVHALLHIAESIRQSGPICMKSAFPFESNIYRLKTHIKGSNGIDRQMAKKNLRECEFDLLKFVCEYEIFYGEERMTFNVHALLHIAESIRQSGPICMNSAFPFESNIYRLKTYIKGSNGMDRQMAKKTLQTWIFKTGNTESLSSSPEVQNYCNNLYRPRRLINFDKDRDYNVTYVGKEVEKDNDLQGSVYNKCIFEGVVYHSIQYNRANKTDDTIVQLQTEEFGRIMKIINVNGQCYFKISIFEMFSDNPFEGVSHIKKIKSENYTHTIYTLINDIKCKVIVVNAKNARYLCSLPNSIEVQ
ncbi:hypothetical protein TSAR_013787 [Trichomalopsis sarcophagae]|uniref:DUF4218 domain-containing protein n=1 Tax=Trichomalopsis sarcophagae TaxID=543379 RepID=A0A232EDK3_9HYME|nr:hypothetical protein TSAR_013787 [Trichomalopsis sarcophagae]